MIHIQLDELWAHVNQTQPDVWVRMACDAKTKIVPVIQVGAVRQEMACSVIHDLKSRLKVECVPVFNSNGLKHYFCARQRTLESGSIRMGKRKRSG